MFNAYLRSQYSTMTDGRRLRRPFRFDSLPEVIVDIHLRACAVARSLQLKGRMVHHSGWQIPSLLRQR
jgi:hypothetical protein